MTRWAAALALVPLPALAAVSGPALQRELDRNGPDALVQAHFVPEAGDGYAAVETGDAQAVGVAALLLRAPHTGGAVTLALRSSLAMALQAHPEAVLPLVNSHPALGADAICVPFLPFDDPGTKRADMLDRTGAALASPAARPFERQANACRKVLSRGYASLRKASRGLARTGDGKGRR